MAMKLSLITFLLLSVSAGLSAQNIGIGTSQPLEKLDVQGGIRVGPTHSQNAGTIRWNSAKNDFEGFNGIEWVSLTNKGGSSWGRRDMYAYEDSGTNFSLHQHNGTHGRFLGFALDEDEDYIYAGAPYDFGTSGVSESGGLYLINKGQTGWKTYPDNEIFPPTPTPGENFGWSVTVDSPYVAVGAPGWNQTRGKFYIYISQGSSYNLLHTFSLGDAKSGDYLGASMDMNVDIGYMAVGIPYRNQGNIPYAGNVAMVKHYPEIHFWSIVQYLSAPDVGQNDFFGYSVAMSGPYLAIGAPGKTMDGKFKQGKVYIYTLENDSWVLIDELLAPDGVAHDEFGLALDMKGDTLVVGAGQFNVNQITSAGKVYVFIRNGQDWDLHSVVSPVDGKQNDNFGYDVSFCNGKLLVGAPFADIGVNTTTGKAYLYRLENNAWALDAIFSRTGLAKDDYFGQTVKLSDYSAIISAPYHHYLNKYNHGRIYYYYP